MSQNFIYDEASDLLLMTGWDKGPQEAYLILGYLNNKGDEWIHPLILDVVNPFDRENNIQWVGEIVVRFAGLASANGLPLLDSVKEYLAQQITNNTVNTCVLHQKDEEPVILDDSPFITLHFRENNGDSQPQENVAPEPGPSKWIVESEEEANEAYFSKLERDIYIHCSEAPGDNQDHDVSDILKKQISAVSAKAVFIKFQSSSHGLNYDDKSTTYNLEPSDEHNQDFMEWFRYSKWFPFFKFDGLNSVSFNFNDLQRAYESGSLGKGYEHGWFFLNEIQFGMISVRLQEYMDGHLEQRKERALQEINAMAEKAILNLDVEQ